MTRKDYELLAAALKTAGVCANTLQARHGVSIAVDCVTNALASDNLRFNRETFAAACATPEADALLRLHVGGEQV
jgi:hypothetical protein